MMKRVNNEGQALVEYVLIKSSCELVGEVYVEGEKSGEGYCAKPNE